MEGVDSGIFTLRSSDDLTEEESFADREFFLPESAQSCHAPTKITVRNMPSNIRYLGGMEVFISESFKLVNQSAYIR